MGRPPGRQYAVPGGGGLWPGTGHGLRRAVGNDDRPDALLCGGQQAVQPALARAIGSAGERLVHTEEVTGSIPVSPTRSEHMLTLVDIAAGAISGSQADSDPMCESG